VGYVRATRARRPKTLESKRQRRTDTTGAEAAHRHSALGCGRYSVASSVPPCAGGHSTTHAQQRSPAARGPARVACTRSGTSPTRPARALGRPKPHTGWHDPARWTRAKRAGGDAASSRASCLIRQTVPAAAPAARAWGFGFGGASFGALETLSAAARPSAEAAIWAALPARPQLRMHAAPVTSAGRAWLQSLLAAPSEWHRSRMADEEPCQLRSHIAHYNHAAAPAASAQCSRSQCPQQAWPLLPESRRAYKST